MSSLVGVDQGVHDALDAEPALRAACGRLAGRGLAPSWIVTHVVSDDGGAHVAYALDLPDAGALSDADLAALVADAFSPDAHPGDVAPHAHDHDLPGPASVVINDVGLGEPHGITGARAALAAQASGVTGRAVVFPGVDALRGTLQVSRVTETSAVEQVLSLGGPFAPDTPLVTRDHVRPYRQGGRWVLAVQPAIGGALVPFEDPAPKRCCQDK